MKIFRIVILSILSIVDLYSLYAIIGYILWGLDTPKLVGNPGTIFTGMYIMSITFGLIFIVATILIVIISIRLRKSKK